MTLVTILLRKIICATLRLRKLFIATLAGYSQKKRSAKCYFELPLDLIQIITTGQMFPLLDLQFLRLSILQLLADITNYSPVVRGNSVGLICGADF